MTDPDELVAWKEARDKMKGQPIELVAVSGAFVEFQQANTGLPIHIAREHVAAVEQGSKDDLTGASWTIVQTGGGACLYVRGTPAEVMAKLEGR